MPANITLMPLPPRCLLRPPTMTKLVSDRFEGALARLRAAGAILVEAGMPESLAPMMAAFNQRSRYELQPVLDRYLSTLPPTIKVRSLKELIAFNKANATQEMPLFGQETLEKADSVDGLDSETYKSSRATALRLAREEGLDLLFKRYEVAALVMPSYGPARSPDPVGVDPLPSYNMSNMAAAAGYPHLSVPMGLVFGMPVGLSLIGPAFSDGELLRYGFAFEATGALREPPRYLRGMPEISALEPTK